jgi:thymidylate synthase
MYEPRTEEFILGLGGYQSIYDLREGFPLMTTKNVPPRLPFEELFWKLRGERNVKSLIDKKIHIWTANAFDHYLKNNSLKKDFPKHSKEWNDGFEVYKEKLKNDPDFINAGDLGPVYGYQWRHWNGIDVVQGHSEGKEWVPEHLEIREEDQLQKVLEGIKKRPGSRYHLLSAWKVDELKKMAIGPCPMLHQFSVFGENLDLNVYQRSCDVFLGVPFNIAQDSLLTHMVANETKLNPRKFIHSYGNVHAYLGVPPRSEFWTNKENVGKFQERFQEVKSREGYLDLKEWYIQNAPKESTGNERKDHIPFILEQLSKEPKILPSLTIIDKKIGLLEAIKLPASDYIKVEGYDPHRWDSKASMAA